MMSTNLTRARPGRTPLWKHSGSRFSSGWASTPWPLSPLSRRRWQRPFARTARWVPCQGGGPAGGAVLWWRQRANPNGLPASPSWDALAREPAVPGCG